jgi:hypothetical protein
LVSCFYDLGKKCIFEFLSVLNLHLVWHTLFDLQFIFEVDIN